MPALFKLRVSQETYKSTIITDAGEFRLSALTPDRAVALWCLGTPYLHITRHGAQLLKDRTPQQVVELLRNCKSVREVDHLSELYPADDALAAAALRRIEQLRTQCVKAIAVHC